MHTDERSLKLEFSLLPLSSFPSISQSEAEVGSVRPLIHPIATTARHKVRSPNRRAQPQRVAREKQEKVCRTSTRHSRPMTAVKMRLKLCVLYWVPLELAFPIPLMSILA